MAPPRFIDTTAVGALAADLDRAAERIRLDARRAERAGPVTSFFGLDEVRPLMTTAAALETLAGDLRARVRVVPYGFDPVAPAPVIPFLTNLQQAILEWVREGMGPIWDALTSGGGPQPDARARDDGASLRALLADPGAAASALSVFELVRLLDDVEEGDGAAFLTGLGPAGAIAVLDRLDDAWFALGDDGVAARGQAVLARMVATAAHQGLPLDWLDALLGDRTFRPLHAGRLLADGRHAPVWLDRLAAAAMSPPWRAATFPLQDPTASVSETELGWLSGDALAAGLAVGALSRHPGASLRWLARRERDLVLARPMPDQGRAVADWLETGLREARAAHGPDAEEAAFVGVLHGIAAAGGVGAAVRPVLAKAFHRHPQAAWFHEDGAARHGRSGRLDRSEWRRLVEAIVVPDPALPDAGMTGAITSAYTGFAFEQAGRGVEDVYEVRRTVEPMAQSLIELQVERMQVAEEVAVQRDAVAATVQSVIMTGVSVVPLGRTIEDSKLVNFVAKEVRSRVADRTLGALLGGACDDEREGRSATYDDLMLASQLPVLGAVVEGGALDLPPTSAGAGELEFGWNAPEGHPERTRWHAWASRPDHERTVHALFDPLLGASERMLDLPC